jgi:hypothetical protein
MSEHRRRHSRSKSNVIPLRTSDDPAWRSWRATLTKLMREKLMPEARQMRCILECSSSCRRASTINDNRPVAAPVRLS